MIRILGNLKNQWKRIDLKIGNLPNKYTQRSISICNRWRSDHTSSLCHPRRSRKLSLVKKLLKSLKTSTERGNIWAEAEVVSVNHLTGKRKSISLILLVKVATLITERQKTLLNHLRLGNRCSEPLKTNLKKKINV